MNKNKLCRSVLATVLAIATLMPTTAFAASIGSDYTDKSVGEDIVQNAKTEYEEFDSEGSYKTSVYLTVDNKDVVVGVPTEIIVSGTPDAQGKYIGNYSVIVNGDFSGRQHLDVIPDENVTLVQTGKTNKEATISQDKTIFTIDDILNNENTSGGSVVAQKLSAGSWNGQFEFNIKLYIEDIWCDLTSQIDWIDGHWNTFGIYNPTTNPAYKYICSNIEVKAGETYRITSAYTGGSDASVLYLKNVAQTTYKSDNLIGYEQISETTKEFTIPEGTNYMCISTYDMFKNQFKLEKLNSDKLGKQHNTPNVDYDFGGNTYLTVTIDDTNANIDEIDAVFASHNMVANYATQPSRLNEPASSGAETKQDVLLRAQERGCEILGHDYRVISSTVDRADTLSWYGDVKDQLTSAGFNVNGYIMAGGTGQNTGNYKDMTDAMIQSGYLYGDLQSAGYDFINYKQYYNPRSFNDSANWANIHIQGIEKIKNNGGGWYNLGTHMNDSNATVDELDALLTWCEENNIQVVTWNYIFTNCATIK